MTASWILLSVLFSAYVLAIGTPCLVDYAKETFEVTARMSIEDLTAKTA